MKQNLGAIAIGILVFGLAGCSNATTGPSKAEACDEFTTAYEPVASSFEFALDAQSKDAMEVHLSAMEEAIENTKAVLGPEEFSEHRDVVVSETQAVVDGSRLTLDGKDSDLNAAAARMLQSLSAIERYCSE